MVYKHVIGLKTDSSQSNLGGNTDSNHLIPGEEWAFFIRLAQPSSRTACNTHFFLLFPGIGCRLFFVLCPSLYLGPCFYSAGCYPAFSYVFSPASDAGVLPPLWRGRVLPFTVQSRDHLATITDIYVPSFSYVHSPALNAGFYFVHCAMENCLDLAIRTGGAAGSDAPTQTLIRLIRRTGRPADTLVYKSHTHAHVCIF